MKYYKTLNITKNHNGSLKYDHNTNKAYSYDWYELAHVHEDYAVLNTYNYSTTTIQHYHKIRSFIKDELGIHNVIEVEAPKGLQSLDGVEQHYQLMIRELECLIAKKGTRKAKNIERAELIRQHKITLNVAAKLLKGE